MADSPHLTTLVNVERACSDFVTAYEQWNEALSKIPEAHRALNGFDEANRFAHYCARRCRELQEREGLKTV